MQPRGITATTQPLLLSPVSAEAALCCPLGVFTFGFGFRPERTGQAGATAGSCPLLSTHPGAPRS